VIFKSPQPPSVSSRTDFSRACLPVGRGGEGGLLVFMIQSDVALVTNAINNRLFSAEIQLTANRCDYAGDIVDYVG
jgi:hypothetical protein